DDTFGHAQRAVGLGDGALSLAGDLEVDAAGSLDLVLAGLMGGLDVRLPGENRLVEPGEPVALPARGLAAAVAAGAQQQRGGARRQIEGSQEVMLHVIAWTPA